MQPETTHTILTQAGNEFQGCLKKQEMVYTKGTRCLLSEYNIKDYGEASFSSYLETGNGEFRAARSMIPFDYLDKKAKDFDWGLYRDETTEKERQLANAFILNFRMFRQKGKGLYIYSATRGTGKTFLAYCLTNEIMRRYDVNVKATTILEYLECTKKGYRSMEDKAEVDGIMKSTVLILDDIGVEVSKEWVNTTLYQLINYRYSNRLVTIITSNFPVEKLRIDDRIKDRINSMCLPLHVPEVPVRTMRTNDENEKFMTDVLKNAPR